MPLRESRFLLPSAPQGPFIFLLIKYLFDRSIEHRMKYKLKEHNSDTQMNWGGNDDTRTNLKIGEIYEAEVEVHRWHTKLIIDGKTYNHICFEQID